MKIQCDVCESAPATVICCADEAALCARCDVEVHAANKLASKHQRLLLQNLSDKLPLCDICREKPAFIFCVEDRALFCENCDEPIHSASSLAANHHRFLATGIRVALSSSSSCTKDAEKAHWEPPSKKGPQPVKRAPQDQQLPSFSSSWEMDELLQFQDFESSDKKHQLAFNELDFIADMGLFADQIPLEAAEVPQLPLPTSHSCGPSRNSKSNMSLKKPRLEFPDDDLEYFTVPDLG
ncbi:hypothetical protein SAY86_005131 [Trapa natans]|uniref:B box-type domain-containing protein n=1 Tax=Trapa natans TaxID=22666 RepID=A0AAN7KU82_TRANT|nr:hypothetical protein SAY86_005131 [Trapa natans]